MRLYERPIDFGIFNAQDSSTLIGINSPYFEKVNITDESNNEIDFYFNLSGFIQFKFLEQGYYDFQNLTEQRYYIHFAQDDTDTLRIEYYLKEGECDFHEYKDLQIYYNDSLYLTLSGENIPSINFYTTINKK